MNPIATVKHGILAGLAGFGALLAAALGGWDASLQTMLMFMALDYVTGVLVAGVFHQSRKSGNGALDSRAGFQGLCKKIAQLLAVLVAVRLDILVGETLTRTAVILFFLGNEGLSILENLGLMGVPYPECIKNALTILKERESDNTLS